MHVRVHVCACVHVCNVSLVLEEERARREPTYYLKMLNPETRATLEQLYQQKEFKVGCHQDCVLCMNRGVGQCPLRAVCVTVVFVSNWYPV